MSKDFKQQENLIKTISYESDLSCVVCGQTRFSSAFKRSIRIRDFVYRSCSNCRSYVLDPLPSEEELGKFYRTFRYYQDLYGDYYFNSIQASYRNFRQWFDCIAPFISSQRDRLVEVGSGAGTFLRVLMNAGYMNVAGYEMNPVALQEAKKNNLPIFSQDLFSGEGEINALFLFDVIEHVTDPSGFLESLWHALKRGGLIVLGTSCNQRWVSRMLGRFWWFLIPPNHVIIYNIPSLEGLLSRLNYELIKTVKINFHWISLSNALAKVRNRFPILNFKNDPLYPSKEFLFPFFHFTSFLTLARKPN